ncbi:MAG: PEP-CTERM sorting domain-containing protein [Planctomycetaceae bacterium]
MSSRLCISLCLLVVASFTQRATANPLYSASAFVDGESSSYGGEDFNDSLAPVTATANPVIPSGTTALVTASSDLYAVTSAADVEGAQDVSEQIFGAGESIFNFAIDAGDLPALSGVFSITASYDINVSAAGLDAATTGYASLNAFDDFGGFDTDEVVFLDNGGGIGTLTISFSGDFTNGVTLQLYSYADATAGTFEAGAPATAHAAVSATITSITLDDVELIDVLPSPIPEPSSLALLAIGGVSIFVTARRRRNRRVVNS